MKSDKIYFFKILIFLIQQKTKFSYPGINVIDTFEAIKMLDKVSLEMKKLGEGAVPYDGGLYPVSTVLKQIMLGTYEVNYYL